MVEKQVTMAHGSTDMLSRGHLDLGSPSGTVMGAVPIDTPLIFGVFVITYNAARHIQQTLARIPDGIWADARVVYVIDDCSTDDTVAKALAFTGGHGKLVVIRNERNQRYGGNQKNGYQYAVDHGLDAVVMLHGDGQYAPEKLREIIAPILEGQADVVIGSRMINKRHAFMGRMPLYKLLGNVVLTRIQNCLCGTSFHEYHSGYRAYRVSLLKSIPFWENTDEWHFDTQILLQAREAKARIVEVAIPTHYGDEVCHVEGLSYARACICTTVSYLLYRRDIVYSRVFDVGAHSSRYKSKFNDPYSSHSLIWNYLNSIGLKGKTVLELGVGDAALTQRIVAAGATIDGIEVDAEAASAARPWCRTVYASDLDSFDWKRLTAIYDVVLAADVLEHLKDPEQALVALKSVVRRDGALIVSLPNVANVYVRANLLLGRFPYHTKGILDRSHLRFFTRKTAEHSLRKTGWVVGRCQPTLIPVTIVFPWMARTGMRFLLRCGYAVTRILKGLLAYQYVFICRNPNTPFGEG